MAFIKTIPLKDLPEGKIKRVMAGKTPVVVVNSKGKIYSFQSECSHEAAPLEEGYLEGNKLVCAWHAAKFDLKSGVVDSESDWAIDIKKYETKVEDGIIFVEI